MHVMSLITFLLLYNLSEGAPYQPIFDTDGNIEHIGVRNLIINTLGLLFGIYIFYGIYVLVDKYITIAEGDTFKTISNNK